MAARVEAVIISVALQKGQIFKKEETGGGKG